MLWSLLSEGNPCSAQRSAAMKTHIVLTGRLATYAYFGSRRRHKTVWELDSQQVSAMHHAMFVSCLLCIQLPRRLDLCFLLHQCLLSLHDESCMFLLQGPIVSCRTNADLGPLHSLAARFNTTDGIALRCKPRWGIAALIEILGIWRSPISHFADLHMYNFHSQAW